MKSNVSAVRKMFENFAHSSVPSNELPNKSASGNVSTSSNPKGVKMHSNSTSNINIHPSTNKQKYFQKKPSESSASHPVNLPNKQIGSSKPNKSPRYAIKERSKANISHYTHASYDLAQHSSQQGTLEKAKIDTEMKFTSEPQKTQPPTQHLHPSQLEKNQVKIMQPNTSPTPHPIAWGKKPQSQKPIKVFHERKESETDLKRKAFQERRKLEKERLKMDKLSLDDDDYVEMHTRPISNPKINNNFVQNPPAEINNTRVAEQFFNEHLHSQQANKNSIQEDTIFDDDGWDYGDQPATIQTIKSSYEMNLPSIIYHFKSKLHLMDEDMVYLTDQINTILETGSQIGQRQRIDKLFDSYKDLEYWPCEILGKGAFGQVFRGIIRKDRTIVAIKVIDLEEAKDDISVISREIQALSECRGCPQLTNYYGSCIRGSELWIIMEYLPGGSIQDKIKIKPLSEKYCAIIAREVLLGLKFLLKNSKIHRDIKAGNILLSADGQVKLADFGATAQLTDTATKCSTFVGSPFWMAPEVMMNQSYNQLCDVWSLGITCIEMAKGRPPHSNEPAIKLVSMIPNSPPPFLKGDFSLEFKHFVKACLVKDPEQRLDVYALLKHPFIQAAGPVSVLQELL